MNSKEYSQLQDVGEQIISRFEIFQAIADQQPEGYFGYKSNRTDGFSIFFYFSTREYRLIVNIDKSATRWARIDVEIPPPGAQHTKCPYEHWKVAPVEFRFDKNGNIQVGDKISTIVSELQVDKVLDVIFNEAPRKDPTTNSE